MLARLPLNLLRQCEREGLDRASLLRESGLSEKDPADPDARVPQSRLFDLWRAIKRRLPADGTGVQFGSRIQVRDAGLV